MSAPLIHQNVDLSNRNTLRLQCEAQYFSEITSDEALNEALMFARERQLDVHVLGEGSNVVLPEKLAGITIAMNQQALSIDACVVSAAAGVNWNELVWRTLDAGAFGLENLVAIPGTAGASPMQNIGAYGAELSSFVTTVNAVHRQTLETVSFSNTDCGFAYRDSRFKSKEKDSWVITGIVLTLREHDQPDISYGGVSEGLEAASLDVNAVNTAKVIARIRGSKLPDPARTANAGSFFKNPLVSWTRYEALHEQFPDMPGFESEGGTKLSAAWLIEKVGFKGYSKGPVGISDQHALVLIHKEHQQQGATAADVTRLSEIVRQEVAARFDIHLEQEPVSF